MKKIYRVMQGVLTSSENGDYWLCESFANLKEATIFFNSIKRDIRGIDLKNNKYLHTTIEKYVFNEDDEVFEFVDCVKAFEYRG